MFNSLTGEITFKGDERLCVSIGGVEWDLVASRKAIERLPPVGQVARIFTHLVHREDAMRLYGFCDMELKPGEERFPSVFRARVRGQRDGRGPPSFGGRESSYARDQCVPVDDREADVAHQHVGAKSRDLRQGF